MSLTLIVATRKSQLALAQAADAAIDGLGIEMPGVGAEDLAAAIMAAVSDA